MSGINAAILTTGQRRQLLRHLLLGGTGLLTGVLLAHQSDASPAPASARVVSIGGALTEIAYALQAQQSLVGVDTTSNFPEATRHIASVGYARSLSLEGILALAPTLILASEDAGPATVIQQLKASGIQIEVIAAHHRYEGLVERITRVAQLLGKAKEGEQLLRRLGTEWQQATTLIAQAQHSRKAAQKAAPKLMFILAHAPNQIMIAGKDTSAHAMMEYAGAQNCFAMVSGYKPLTPEALLAAQPDMILTTDQGLKANGGLAALLQRPGFAQTPAGRNKRVISMEAMALLGFGPRLPQALRELHQAIHGAMGAA